MVLCSWTSFGKELGSLSGEESCCSFTNVEEGHPTSTGAEVLHSAVQHGCLVVVVGPALNAGTPVAEDPPTGTGCSSCICSFQTSLMMA